MGSYDEILDQVPVDQLASQLGVDSDEVRRAAENALPALLGGLHANAADPAGADSLMAALSDHQGPVTGLDDVDEQDGRAIVGNIFGDNTDQVVNQLGGVGGVSGGIVQKLLPILAPIVLSWLAGKIGQGGGLGGMFGGSEPAPSTGAGPTDDGALFPGGAGAGSAPVQAPGSATSTGAASTGDSTAGSNPLQDVLGQVLGGGSGGGASTGGAGDILGGLLGGLLGGGKR
jgi:hypothetical protein